MKFKLSFFFLGFIFQSCQTSSDITFSNFEYTYNDTSGEYYLYKNVGKKKNQIFTKRELNKSSDNSLVEKTLAISQVGILKDYKIFIPKASQFTVWLEGNKYLTQTVYDKKNKNFQVIARKDNKQILLKKFKIPNSKKAYCYFSQLEECINFTNFFSISRKRKVGQMYFYLIWDNFPFQINLYDNIPSKFFTQASLKYDGLTKDKLSKYILSIEGQSLFFHVSKNNEIVKNMWVVQGITQILNN